VPALSRDALDRLRKVTDGEGNETEYDYDAEGNRTLVKEPEGQETNYSYDELGKLLTVTQPSVAAGTPVTQYEYDLNRNLLYQTDAKNQVTGMQYDELNRLTKRIEEGGAETIFDYDENGNETLRTDPKKQQVVSTYDARNRLDTQRFDFAPSDPTRPWRHTTHVDYGYDENSNVTQIEESVASGLDPPSVLFTELHFDRLDRLESETTPLPDGGTKTVEYSYFKNGLRKSLSEGGAKTAYEYDFQNHLKGVTLLAETPAAAPTSYKYYADGLLREVSTPNGVKTTHLYDKADRVTSIETTRGSTVVSAFGYGYYPNGNRKTQTETNGGLVETTSYGYDALNRLLSVTYPPDAAYPAGRTVTYGYDKVGNRTHETETDAQGAVLSEKSGDFDDRNRLTALTDLVDPTKSVAFGYDANGNLTQKTLNPTELGLDSVVTSYHYDARDLLVEAGEESTTPPAEPGGMPVVTAGVLGRFQYDFDGKRTKKIGLEGTRQYVYDDTSILAEYTTAGAPVARYDYGSDRLVSLFRVDEPRKYFHFDALGSVTNLTADVTGTTSASYHWDAWGNARFPSELTASKNKFGFTGYERDGETGLYNAKARYFDPQLGRFTAQDPHSGFIEMPETLNAYAYVHNRPTVYTDPDGDIVPLVVAAVIGLKAAFYAGSAAFIGHTAYQKYKYDREVFTMDPSRAVHVGEAATFGGKVGVAAGATVFSGGLAGPWAAGGLFAGGAGLNVAEQRILGHRSWSEVDYSSAAAWGGLGTLPGAGVMKLLAYSGRIAQTTRLGIAGFGAYGAYRGGEMAYEGYEEGDWAKAGLGAVEGTLGVLGAAWGVRSFAAHGGFGTFRFGQDGLLPRGGAALEQLQEYRRFRGQGYSPAQSRYLTQPYSKTGQHFVYDRTLRGRGALAEWYKDSSLNLYRGRDMSIGRFYEYHARLHQTPKFGIKSPAGQTWAFPKAVGGGRWYYSNVLDAPQPWGRLGYLLHGSPLRPASAAVGSAILSVGLRPFTEDDAERVWQ